MLNKKPIKYALIAVLSVVFVVSAVMLIKNLSDSKREQDEFDELYKIMTETNISTDSTPSDTVSQAPQSPQQPTLRDITKLREINSECVGWVCIPNTKVNYPVMHTPNDPEKYLKRNFYNKYSGSGVPFIDARCSLNSNNIIIYGHNMTNRTIFGSLREYLKPAYLKAHPVIEFETESGCEYYTITEVRKTDIYDDWYSHNLYSEQDGKKYLTLSTCYGTNKSARLLIIAVKNEDSKSNTDETENTNSDITQDTSSQTEG